MIASEPAPHEPSSSERASTTTVTTTNGTSILSNGGDVVDEERDEFYQRLRTEALQVLQDEPEMERLIRMTVLAPHVHSFEDAVIQTLCHRLLLPSATPLNHRSSSDISDEDDDKNNENDRYPMSPKGLRKLVHLCMDSDMEEKGWTISEAIRKDAIAVVERDPAMESILEVVLFAKG